MLIRSEVYSSELCVQSQTHCWRTLATEFKYDKRRRLKEGAHGFIRVRDATWRIQRDLGQLLLPGSRMV